MNNFYSPTSTQMGAKTELVLCAQVFLYTKIFSAQNEAPFVQEGGTKTPILLPPPGSDVAVSIWWQMVVLQVLEE